MNSTDTPTSGQAKVVPCPTCGGDSLYVASNPFRPFCSNRCKNVDLGAWANEDFRMAAKAAPEDLLTDDEQ